MAMALMTNVNHKSNRLTPQIEAILSGLDHMISRHGKNVDNIETLLTRNKLEICYRELENVQCKLHGQEKVIQSLRERNKYLENNVHTLKLHSNDSLVYETERFERERVCLHKNLTAKEAEYLDLNQGMTTFREEIKSLKSSLGNRNTEIRQLNFRKKNQDNELEKYKNKITRLERQVSDLIYENSFLNESILYLKTHEMSIASRCQCFEHDFSIVKTRTYEHEKIVETRQQMSIRDLGLRDEYQRAKEQVITLQEINRKISLDIDWLKDKLKEKETEVHSLRDQSERLEKLKAETETKIIKEIRDKYTQIIYFKEQLKQSREKEASMCRIINELQNEIRAKDKKISELNIESKLNAEALQKREYELSKKTNQFRDAENELKIIISKQCKDLQIYKEGLEKRDVEIAERVRDTKQNQQLKEELYHSKENDIRRSVYSLTSKLRKKDETISELKHQLSTASETLENMKSDFENMRQTVQKQVESEIDRYKLENKQRETNQKEFENMSLENESLKRKLKLKEEALQENHIQSENAKKDMKETRSKLNETIDKQNIQIQNIQDKIKQQDSEIRDKEHLRKQNEYLQQELVISGETEKALRQTINELQLIGHTLQMQTNKTEAKMKKCVEEMEQAEKQSNNLKLQMCTEIEGFKKELKEASLKKETELRKVNSDLQTQLETMERNMKHQTRETTREKEIARTNKTSIEKMSEEINLFKSQIKEKENYNKRLKDRITWMESEESKLNEIVNKQKKEIQHLRDEIREKDMEETRVDQVKNRNEEIQQAFNQLKEKELDLRKMNQVLQNRNEEMGNEVTELKEQLNVKSKASDQTENKLMNINHSLAQQLKNTETKLTQQQLEISHEKELATTNRKCFVNMSEEMERLKLEMKEKETTLQEYNKLYKDAVKREAEATSNLNEITNKEKEMCQHLQQELEKRDIALASMGEVNKRCKQLEQALNESLENNSKLSEKGKTITVLQSINQEKEDQVITLKRQKNEMLKAFDITETELRNMNCSLQAQLNTTEVELSQLKRDISHEKTLVSTNQKHMANMSKEVERLKQAVEQKEQRLLECNEQCEATINMKEKVESTLNEIIEKQKREIKNLKEDIKTKDVEVNRIEQVMKQKSEIQEALDELHAKEAALRKNSQDLQSRNQDKEDEITKLKKQLNELKKTSYRKENELRNMNTSLERRLEITETELKKIKEAGMSNEKASLSAKVRHEKMAEEIERLKLDVKLNENMLQESRAQYTDCEKRLKEAESNLKEIISKQKEDIHHLQAKIKMQNIDKASIDQVKTQSKQVQEALNVSCEKEAELRKSINVLQRKNEEKEGKINELKNQMNELSDMLKQKENQLECKNSSLQTKLQIAESKLTGLQQEISHEKELLSKYQKCMMKNDEQIESLKQEVKEKEAQMQEFNVQYKKEEFKLKEIINKQKTEIQHLEKQIVKAGIEVNDILQVKKHSEEVQQALNNLYDTEAELRKSNQVLHSKNKQKEDEVSELSERLKTANQKENELNDKIYSIEQQLKNTEAKMMQQRLDISHERELMIIKDKDMVKMDEEIESLKLEVKQKESMWQKCSAQYKDAVYLKQESESKLNEIINKHKAEIRHLRGDIEEKNTELARIDEIHKRYKEVKKTLNESQAKEITLSETIKELRNINLENENRISELKRILQKSSEESHKMENELKETIHLLNKKIKGIETENVQYKQDIANAKQLSIAAQKKMSEMDTQINDLTNKLKAKEEEQQKGEENLGGIIDSQSQQIQQLEKEVQKRERKMKTVEIEKNSKLQEMEKHMVELNNQMKHLLSKLRDTEAELDETKSRLSRVMGDRLTDNNPNITDLSDRNRPTKIAEKCAELYDNEWTDAFDVLEKLYRTEEAAIEALLLILQNAMHFCKTMARRQIEIIEREMCFADEKEKIKVSSDIQKLIKDRRKATATAVVGNLKKIYVAQLKQSKDKTMRAALDVEPYTSECIEICWFMLIQDPPVVFAPLPIKGSSFDTNFYKPYTKSGTHVDFAVWPALLLHEKGPILAKGVAQGHGNK